MEEISSFYYRFVYSFCIFFFVSMMLGGAYYSGVLAGYVVKYYGLNIEDGRFIAYFILNCILMIIIWLYFIFMTRKFNATFGKMIMKIKVVSDKNLKISLWKLIMREIIGKYIYLIIGIILTIFSFISSLPIGEKFNFIIQSLIIIVVYGMILFTKQKQALYDKIAGTIVLLEK